MGFHAFSLDPRTILGIGPEATLDEVHEAYRTKSKKHHPDRGGDDWAFRMVTRAYEVLKTTAEGPSPRSAPTASWAPAAGPWPGRGTGADSTATATAGANDRVQAEDPSGPASDETRADGPWPDPSRARNVDVELIWTRFEKDGPARLMAERDADDSTLSVCMVLSWPEADIVDQAAEFPDTAETLRRLIDLFERLRGDRSIVAARSRIEDGRFVGWLSYPDVLTAQDAIHVVRDTFRDHGLTIKLQTRDERIPFAWQSEAHSPVMSQAS